MMKKCTILVLFLCVVVSALAQDSFQDTGVRFALKLYDDCSKSSGLSPCLKRKAFTFLDRLSRMEKFNLTEGVTVTKTPDAASVATTETTTPVVTEEALEKTLPRSADAQDAILDNMLIEKVSSFVSSRTVSVALPRVSAEDFVEYDDESGRKIGGKKGKKLKKGLIAGLFMMIAAKMAGLIPIGIAGLFLLAGKALIIAKIALLLSGIIALKKLVASKQHHNDHGHSSGWQASSGHGGWEAASSGGHGGGWQSGGSGWDKRSLDDAQKMAYSAYNLQ